MNTNTAGPWRAEPDVREYKGVKELAGWNIYAGARDEVVGCEGILSDGEANARLIAAAPELLAALRVAVVALAHATMQTPGNLVYEEAYQAVDEAIFKATRSAA